MTVVCGGGTSSARPGVGQSIYIGSAAAGALLNNIPVAWAVPLAAFIGANTYEASAFCTQDPPADPGITAIDVGNLFANISNPAGSLVAAQKVAQLVARYAWYVFCQCDTVATPAPPAAPAAPTNMPTVADTGSCAFAHGTPCTPTSGLDCGSVGFRCCTWASTDPALPVGATRLVVTTTAIDHTAHNQVLGDVNFYNSAHAHLGHNLLPALSPGQSRVDTVLVPATAAFFAVGGSLPSPVSPADTELQASVQVFCDSTTNTTDNCCSELRTTVEQMYDLVTIIQRQLIPFAFIDGTTTSVSGTNHYDITQSLVGVRVTLTATPSSLGSSVGDPTKLFDAGYISLGDADGWFATRRLDQISTLWVPHWASAVTRIGYSLPAGATATITELHREP